MYLYEKVTVGGVALWSGQFVKAWSKTIGILALRSGESELAAVVRAASNEVRCNCCDWDGPSTWIGKVRHLAVGDLWVQHHVRSGKIRVSKMSGLENPSDAQTKYLGPEPALRHAKACNWVPIHGV